MPHHLEVHVLGILNHELANPLLVEHNGKRLGTLAEEPVSVRHVAQRARERAVAVGEHLYRAVSGADTLALGPCLHDVRVIDRHARHKFSTSSLEIKQLAHVRLELLRRFGLKGTADAEDDATLAAKDLLG